MWFRCKQCAQSVLILLWIVHSTFVMCFVFHYGFGYEKKSQTTRITRVVAAPDRMIDFFSSFSHMDCCCMVYWRHCHVIVSEICSFVSHFCCCCLSLDFHINFGRSQWLWKKGKKSKKNSIRSFSNGGISEFVVIMKCEHDTFVDCCSSTSNKTTIFQFQPFRFKFQVIYKFKHENAILSYRCAPFYLRISDFWTSRWSTTTTKKKYTKYITSLFRHSFSILIDV